MSRYPTLLQLADEILRGRYIELLKTPTLSAASVRALGIDPRDPNLIHVTGLMGERYPAFQFDGGTICPVVIAVNRLLDAEEDPLGVWDWWVGRNNFTVGGRPPVILLGGPAEEQIMFAAKAVLEDI